MRRSWRAPSNFLTGVLAIFLTGWLGLAAAQATHTVPADCQGEPVTIAGTDGDDNSSLGGTSLIGTAGEDSIAGGSGSDRIEGRESRDFLCGNDDPDIIHGNQGDDIINGGGGTDSIQGNDGSDEIHGGSGPDNITGQAGADTIYGDLGDDTLSGRDGQDTLRGNEDNETFADGLHYDVLRGHAGTDEWYPCDDDGVADSVQGVEIIHSPPTAANCDI